jgi:hypothetical protein
MVSGDPQRVWFEEMVEMLRSRWHREMSFKAMIQLRDDLDEMRQRIRRERQIRSPLTTCPECGDVGESAPPHVSVRAMILSVIRFGIDDAEATRALEKAWTTYEKANYLDLYGKPAAPKTDAVGTTHVHSH